jgi:hypothetical protein
LIDCFAVHRCPLRPGRRGVEHRHRLRFELEDEVADLEAVIEAVGFARVSLSCAGPPAIAYAAVHPERVERLMLYVAYADGQTWRGRK